jgi:NTP pyrophosphatase (non-canonical NTP hydrolase)
MTNDKMQGTLKETLTHTMQWANTCYPTEDQKLTSPVVQVIGPDGCTPRLRSYAEFVGSLFKCMDTHAASCAHAAFGVVGESGELADAVKKYWVYGKPVDRANIVEELGDLRFYMQALQNLLGITDQEVILNNAEKLRKRYPTGQYSDKAAQVRLDKQTAPACVGSDNALADSALAVTRQVGGVKGGNNVG